MKKIAAITALIISFAFSAMAFSETAVTKFNTIAAGRYHALSISDMGALYAWGENTSGQLGSELLVSQIKPVHVMNNVSAVAAGSSHSMCVTNDSIAYAWGDNAYGQLGFDSPKQQAIPTAIMLDTAAVAAGDSHSVILSKNGNVYTLGNNQKGQLGIRTLTRSANPVKVLSGIEMIAAYGDTTIAMKPDGTLYGWGDNSSRQLSPEQIDVIEIPQKLMTKVEWASIGRYISFMKAKQGSVSSSGTWEQGLIAEDLIELDTAYDQYIVNAASGEKHALLINQKGELFGLGDNSKGQLGALNPSYLDKFTKIMDEVKLIACGDSYSLIMKNDQSVYMLGTNLISSDSSIEDKQITA